MPDRTVSSSLDTEVVLVDNLTVRIARSTAELTQDASQQAIAYLETLLANQETASIILATGNSQLEFLAAIATSTALDWSRIKLFHLDEYLGISDQDKGSFRYYLHHKVEKIVKPRIFHYIQGDATEPLKECNRYSHLLQQQAIDLCLLGIGDNGHLAFNEPHIADFQDSYLVKLVKLEHQTRQQQVNGGSFANLAAVPHYAYTLTIPAICNAQKIFCLAGGKHKAEVVAKTLNQTISPAFPATILRQQSQATLFCTDGALSIKH